MEEDSICKVKYGDFEVSYMPYSLFLDTVKTHHVKYTILNPMKTNCPILGFAKGSYFCKCINCGDNFTGDKRAVQCEPCAINELQEMYEKVCKENDELKTALCKMEDALDLILNRNKP